MASASEEDGVTKVCDGAQGFAAGQLGEEPMMVPSLCMVDQDGGKGERTRWLVRLMRERSRFPEPVNWF